MDQTPKAGRAGSPQDRPAKVPLKGIALGTLAMAVIVTASNYLVQFPINDWLTWGAVSYPFAFLVTDLTNRTLGPAAARKVIYIGFALGVVLSLQAAGIRIAVASGTAFLAAQLLDIYIFNRLRRGLWWRAPLVSSSLASALDTALFFSLAFAGSGLPWVGWGIGDFAAKLGMALIMLIPFLALMTVLRPASAETVDA